MSKPLKLHLACGTVYLEDGWTNIDIEGHFAKDRPDLVGVNGTTLDNYYKKEVTKDDFMSGKLHNKEKVIDQLCDITKLPYKENSVDEILGVQILEHFSLLEAKELLKYWYSLLRISGTLTLHVPDVEGIMYEWNTNTRLEGKPREEINDWALRQIYGSQKNQYSIHKYGYTKESLSKLLLECGFSATQEVATINNYPSIGILAVK